jgi:hypothetical protein
MFELYSIVCDLSLLFFSVLSLCFYMVIFHVVAYLDLTIMVDELRMTFFFNIVCVL